MPRGFGASIMSLLFLGLAAAVIAIGWNYGNRRGGLS